MKEAKTHLAEDGFAFYDALAENGSEVEVLGDKSLGTVVKLFVQKVRKKPRLIGSSERVHR